MRVAHLIAENFKLLKSFKYNKIEAGMTHKPEK
jgi:hypothetical protein